MMGSPCEVTFHRNVFKTHTLIKAPVIRFRAHPVWSDLILTDDTCRASFQTRSRSAVLGRRRAAFQAVRWQSEAPIPVRAASHTSRPRTMARAVSQRRLPICEPHVPCLLADLRRESKILRPIICKVETGEAAVGTRACAMMLLVPGGLCAVSPVVMRWP